MLWVPFFLLFPTPCPLRGLVSSSSLLILILRLPHIRLLSRPTSIPCVIPCASQYYHPLSLPCFSRTRQHPLPFTPQRPCCPPSPHPMPRASSPSALICRPADSIWILSKPRTSCSPQPPLTGRSGGKLLCFQQIFGCSLSRPAALLRNCACVRALGRQPAVCVHVCVCACVRVCACACAYASV